MCGSAQRALPRCYAAYFKLSYALGAAPMTMEVEGRHHTQTMRWQGTASAHVETLAYSVVIEWGNVLLAGHARAIEMLRRLAIQMQCLRDQGIDGEAVLVQHADDPASKLVPKVIQNAFGSAAGNVSTVATRHQGYHEKKNAGAIAAKGEIVVFLDSDVLPEDRWLESLLSPFWQTDAAVVAGTTYLEPSTMYTKAVAAFWFFPPRSNEEGMVTADPNTIFGNNIAFRRQVFLEHQYPVLDQFRGQQGVLLRNLREKGFKIYLQRGARCEHPAPNGIVHFFCRALCEGYDNIVISRREAGGGKLPWRHTYWSLRSSLLGSLKTIVHRKRALNLSAVDVVAASMIALCYIAFMMLGEVITRIDPGLVPRRFSI